jgi:sodium-coupled neutral amino acid transporter 11
VTIILTCLLEFELDSDELDVDESSSQFDDVQMTPTTHRSQGMPLLVGLLDAAASRRSLDGSFYLRQGNGHSLDRVDNIDLEDLAAKRRAGGGMLDSIANMANSILGAGNASSMTTFCTLISLLL